MIHVIVEFLEIIDPISMKEVNTALKEQHQRLLQTVQELRAAWTERNFDHCKRQSQELLKQLNEHHLLESKNLFLKLFGHPALSMGGPFCTYFFDFFMMNRPFESTLKLINEIRTAENKMLEIPIPENEKIFFDQNSMLSIPLEEHISQQLLARELCDYFEKDPVSHTQWVSKTLDLIEDLMRKNFEKEDTCLSVLSLQILGSG